LEKVTVPAGLAVPPVLVSVTVALQVVVAFTASDVSAHVTVVDVG